MSVRRLTSSLALTALVTASSAAFCEPLPAREATTAAPPNVLLIVLDDLDVFDVGAYGSPDIQTPAMDRLAREGMRFTRYYAAGPVCSPSRAGLLTGQYPAQFGIHRAVVHDSMRGIPAGVSTIGEVLAQAGYQTAHMGKWHVGTHKPEFLPPAKGFQHSVRLTGKDYYEYGLVIDEARTEEHDNGPHLTTTLTDKALTFLVDHRNPDTGHPFFLNLWYLAPHIPIEPPADFDNSETGYCLSRDPHPEECDTRRGDYAALVTHADRQIQRLLQYLDQSGLAANTLVLLMSDNGGARPFVDRTVRDLRGFKGNVFDGGIRVPFIARWPGRIRPGVSNDSVVVGIDVLATLAELVGEDPHRYDTVGTSFLDTMVTGGHEARPGPVFWENKYSNGYFDSYDGNRNAYAVRDGRWKLVSQPGLKAADDHRLYLFDVQSDPQERHNLIEVPESHAVDALDYRLTLSKTTAAPEALVADDVVTKLQNEYIEWRRATGQIDYQVKPAGQGVTVDGDTYRLSGGHVSVARDVRLDFHDGDFTFATRVDPARSDRRATIAQKPDSWELYLTGSGTLALDIVGEKPKSTVTLQAPLQGDGVRQVAFTVFGLRGDASIVSLYVDGRLADQRSRDQSVRRVRANDPGQGPMLFIGNSEDGSTPFYGTIQKPLMSVLALYPSEIFLQYSNL